MRPRFHAWCWGISLSLVFSLVLALAGCASLSGPRHIATVSIVTAHSTLAFLQDTETALVCNRPSAPPAPSCIPLPLHHELSQKLATAFSLDEQVALLTRDIPLGSPTPTSVISLLSDITGLISSVVSAIPDSPQKQALVQNLGGAK